MSEERLRRRLAAILIADVAGYSRLMGTDEAGTLSRLKRLRTELLAPKAAELGGRIVKSMGDGLLVEFPSAVDAVQYALDVQQAMAGRDDDSGIALRIGVNLGDVISEGEDIYGDGVNVAARLESIAEPGGICISGTVREHVGNRLSAAFEDMGAQRLKNIAEPVRVYRVGPASPRDERPSLSARDQIVRFCTAADGVSIAYATVGRGPPLVRAGHWLSHLELDWEVPTRREMMEVFAPRRTVVRYDARGNGLSDWDVEDISFESFVGDMEAVIDDLGIDRLALFGQSQGAAVACAYAARHPEKVTHLVVLGGYARGRRWRETAGQIAESDAFVTLIREGWGKSNPAYVQMFGSMFMPDADHDELAGFTRLQRMSATPDNAARIRYACDDIDVSRELAAIRAPTLILHAHEDAMVPLAEGRRLAAAIRGARFVQLESRNHSPLSSEPAWKRFLDETMAFLAS